MKKMLGSLMGFLAAFLLTMTFMPTVSALAAGVEKVANETELREAINDDSVAEIIITADITVTAELTIDGDFMINGGGHTISVETPGMTDSGLLNDNPSKYRVFNITGGTVHMKNLTILGGSAKGGAIYVASGGTVELNQVNIARSGGGDRDYDHYYSFPGGGIFVDDGGSAYIDKCSVSRNSAEYGGGFLNYGYMVITNSSFAENRSLGSGGGAVENNGTMFINNCVFANNKSSELGGAINDYKGITYILNSTFTGNVAYTDGVFGGALRGNTTTLLLNCVFAYNYTENAQTLNDSAESDGEITVYNSILHGTTPSRGKLPYLNQYDGAHDGSNDTMFAGGALTQVLSPNGEVIAGSLEVFQPFLYEIGGLSVVALNDSYNMPKALRTIFHPDKTSPVIGFWDEDTNKWIQLVYEGVVWAEHDLAGDYSQYEVTTDQLDKERTIIGSANYTKADLYMLKLLYDSVTAHGQVSGLSIYGDVYPAGTNVEITAVPDPGYGFDRWMLSDGTEYSSANPLNITVSEDLTLFPLYKTAAPNVGNISAPRWRENSPAALELPICQEGISQTTAEGWEISDDGSTGWTAFTPPAKAEKSCDGKYLRYYMTNSHGTAYSNTVQITVIDENAREITIEMWDRYGDSWSGCALKIVVNETKTLPNATLANNKFTDYYYFAIDPGHTVKFY